jgi:hypothetical protein
MSEELNFDEQPILVPQEEIIAPEIEAVEEAPQVQEKPKATKKKEAKKVVETTNELKVVRIVQRVPSGFRLLLENGQIVKVTKNQFKLGQKTVVL